MAKQGAISYQYDELMMFKDINNVLPQRLVPYCVHNTTKEKYPTINMLDDQLKNIITSITKGDDPNNVILRTYIKFYVNTIHQGTYDEYLEKLKKLDYSSKENVHFLLSELIMCASRCAISVKGFSFQEDNKHKTIPEICADVTKEFSGIIIKTDTEEISFHSELVKMCQQYFLNYVDLNRSLDENNENTVENYKGFMTFMGLLYSKGVIGISIVGNCIEIIKRSIFCSHRQALNMIDHNCNEHIAKLSGYKKQTTGLKNICFYDCSLNKCCENETRETHRKAIECSNLYVGYEHLLSHVVHALNKTNKVVLELEENKENLKQLNESHKDYQCICDSIENQLASIKKIGSFVNKLIHHHQEIIELNKQYKSLNKNQLISPFKTHVLLIHNSIGANLNKLTNIVGCYCDEKLLNYESVQIGKQKS